MKRQGIPPVVPGLVDTWRAITGAFAAGEGCECQILAMSILERGTKPTPIAARDLPLRSIAERSPR